MRRPIALALAVALLVGGGGAARGNGAFPDAAQILVPDGSDAIYVGTNFGLVIGADGGGPWRWVCEGVIGRNAVLYQRGPSGRLFAVTAAGLSSSSDGACSWSLAGGAIAGERVVDAFPDGSDGAVVYAIAQPFGEAGLGAMALHRSSDGGATFGAPLHVAPDAGDTLGGVETAAGRIYLTQLASGHPFLLRSDDGGATFAASDVHDGVGDRSLRIAAVDPQDADVLYLRAIAVDGDALAISSDGGATARIAATLATRMSAFLRRADGTLLVGDAAGHLLRSTDGGVTLAPAKSPGHVRALAERRGVLYAATEDRVDGYAVAVSRDDGASWQPLLRLADLAGPLACADAAGVCTAAWPALQATLAPPPMQMPSPAPSPHGGCACRSDGGKDDAAALPGLLAVAGVLLFARRSRRSSGLRR